MRGDAARGAPQGFALGRGVEFTNGGEPGVKLKAKVRIIPLDKLNASNDE